MTMANANLRINKKEIKYVHLLFQYQHCILPHESICVSGVQLRRYKILLIGSFHCLCNFMSCTVPKYHAAVNYTPRLRASRNLPRCTANSDTCEAVANNYPGSATANSYLSTMST